MFKQLRVQITYVAFVLLYSLAARTEPYAVKRGDSLTKIAADHGVTVAQLLNANPLVKKSKDHLIWPTMLLVVPEASPVITGNTGAKSQQVVPLPRYTVKAGDSLNKVASEHQTTVAQLLDANPQLKRKKGRGMYPGMSLVIPALPPANPPAISGDGPSPADAPLPADKDGAGVSPSAPNVEPAKTPAKTAAPPAQTQPSHDETALTVYDGVVRRGWVVTYNPSIGSNVLFVHRSSGGGMLTDLRYYIKESSDGQWTVYDASESRIDGNQIKGSPKTVMAKPASVSKGRCDCR